MPALSFQPRFVRPILDGAKDQTIRPPRKVPIRPGQTLHLFTGMRTKRCRRIATVPCARVGAVLIDFTVGCVAVKFDNGSRFYGCLESLNTFAQADGFASWGEMRAFWREHHPGVDVFVGDIIAWEALRPLGEERG